MIVLTTNGNDKENDMVTELGYTNPGPDRWLRAINGAINKPDSAHARLLASRIDSVKELLDTPNFWSVTHSIYTQRTRYFCSDFCVGLGLHLLGEHPVESIRDIVAGGQVIEAGYNGVRATRFEADRLVRPTVKCFTCGGKMDRRGNVIDALIETDDFLNARYSATLSATEKKTTVDVAEPTKPTTKTVFLDNDGKILNEQPKFREVELTARERRLLDYIPQHLRFEALSQLEQL